MKKSEAIKSVPVQSIPEVAALEQTKERIKAFMTSNPDFFKYWNDLLDEYNERVAAAAKVVKAQGVSCGDFELYQYGTTYDADYMYERYGREQFLELGGKLETRQERSLDKTRVDLNIQLGKISEEDALLIRKKSPRYHAPSAVEVPKV